MNPAFEDAQVVTAAELVAAVSEQVKAVPAPLTFISPNLVYGDNVTQTPMTFLHKIADTEAWVASADLKRPPADWFTDPLLDEPTPLTIDDDGRVFGHLALWNTCHRGFESQCVTPPREATEYAEFHDNARVMTADGKMLGVGCLTFDVSHADIRASTDAAKRHYDHSGTVAAFVRAGQDNYGVYVAGAIKPGMTDDQIEMMRRLSLSGDWRPKGGNFSSSLRRRCRCQGSPSAPGWRRG